MNIEFNLLRYRFIVFAVVLVVGFVVVLASNLLLNSKRNYNAIIEGKIESTNSSTAQLINDEALVEAYHNDYKKIVSRGFSSEESRLSWIEQLESTAARLQLNNLQYHIEPQLTVNDSGFNISPNISLFNSRLSFETGLVHEGDLVDIVNDLAALSAGLLVLDRCKLSKTDKRLLSGNSYNFTASCDLSWYKAGYLEKMAGQVSGNP